MWIYHNLPPSTKVAAFCGEIGDHVGGCEGGGPVDKPWQVDSIIVSLKAPSSLDVLNKNIKLKVLSSSPPFNCSKYIDILLCIHGKLCFY